MNLKSDNARLEQLLFHSYEAHYPMLTPDRGAKSPATVIEIYFVRLFRVGMVF